jgi:2-polyprenyl-6-methoxyphenol hydroxylase-like FAD-dependent oxidoreductase
MKAVIAGGGVGGLSAALALHRQGFEVQVLERADGPAAGGAALSLWPNALRALDVLGVGASVREHAALGGDSGVRRPDGRWLARTRLGPAIIARFGDPLIIVTRRRLADLLRAELPAGAVRHGQVVTGVTAGDPGSLATVWTTATTAEADLVIGADGARSVLRRSLFGSAAAPRYAGYTAWRMIARSPSAAPESFETWGPGGTRFAVLPLSDGTCYCYATLVTPENTTFNDDLGELRRLFGKWHRPIPDILAGLANTAVLRNDITELSPLPTLHRGRVALLGDAGHAMTPELGQGACLAIEDAVVLAAAIATTRAGDIPAALERYTSARLSRATAIARRSHRAGALHGHATAVRYATARVMNRVPTRLIIRGLEPVINWHPPPGC